MPELRNDVMNFHVYLVPEQFHSALCRHILVLFLAMLKMSDNLNNFDENLIDKIIADEDPD